MPPVIPIVAGVAATAGAGAVGLFGATTAFGAGTSLFGTVAGGIIGGLASVATSACGKPELPENFGGVPLRS